MNAIVNYTITYFFSNTHNTVAFSSVLSTNAAFLLDGQSGSQPLIGLKRINNYCSSLNITLVMNAPYMHHTTLSN